MSARRAVWKYALWSGPFWVFVPRADWSEYLPASSEDGAV